MVFINYAYFGTVIKNLIKSMRNNEGLEESHENFQMYCQKI